MHVRAHRGGERVAHSSQSAEPSLFQSIRSTLGSGGIRDRFSLTDCAVLKQTRNVTNSDTNCREPTYFGRPTIYLLGTVQLPRKGRLNRIRASLRRNFTRPRQTEIAFVHFDGDPFPHDSATIF